MKFIARMLAAVLFSAMAVPALAASLANRIASEQAAAANRVAPMNLADGVTIIGVLADGPVLTYQIKLSGPFGKFSRESIQEMKPELTKGACQNKVERAALAQGVTKKYSVQSDAGAHATFTVTASDCRVKRGEVVRFNDADLKAVAEQTAAVLPLKYSDDMSMVAATAEGMTLRLAFLLSRQFDEEKARQLADITRKYACSNANLLVMMTGGARVVLDYVGADRKPLVSLTATPEACSGA